MHAGITAVAGQGSDGGKGVNDGEVRNGCSHQLTCGKLTDWNTKSSARMSRGGSPGCGRGNAITSSYLETRNPIRDLLPVLEPFGRNALHARIHHHDAADHGAGGVAIS